MCGQTFWCVGRQAGMWPDFDLDRLEGVQKVAVKGGIYGVMLMYRLKGGS